MTDSDHNELDFAKNLSFAEILTNPFLDIAARFWASERYQAFRVCYRSMRRIDDLVDDRKASGAPISPDEISRYRLTLQNWLESVQERSTDDEYQKEFVATVDRFAIPLWPWERLCEAMAYDLEHSGFKSLTDFLRYTEGAAIAPASVFMHLCGVNKEGERYLAPGFDIRKAARPLAIYSYLVHIIRDFQKDQLRGLDYFADNLLAEYGLSGNDLRQIARGAPIPASFRELIARYVRFAEHYRDMARHTIDRVKPQMESRYQLSLEIIYGLYSLVFERIDPSRGTFTEKELNPPPEEVQARLEQVVAEFRPAPTA